jgi:hypothetical protein
MSTEQIGRRDGVTDWAVRLRRTRAIRELVALLGIPSPSAPPPPRRAAATAAAPPASGPRPALLPLWVSGPTRGRMVLGRLRAGRRARLIATEDSSRPLDRAVPRWRARRAARRRGQRGAAIVIGPSQAPKVTKIAVGAVG